MAVQFKKATKENARLRMALTGVSGSGKTYTGLEIATGLGDKIAVIDTERGSASKYADLFDFDVLELDRFSPENYKDAVQAAEDAGYNVIIIDSFSHAWMGTGGILEIHDKETSNTKDSFRAWGKVTPQHNKILDRILSSRCHIIATMRSKSEYSVDKNAQGKTQIQKIGMAPVQKDGVEYEFDVVASLNLENILTIEKTRCIALSGKTFDKDGKGVAEILKAWLSPNEASADQKTRAALVEDITAILKDLNTAGDIPQWTPVKRDEFLEECFGAKLDDLGYEKLEKVLETFQERLAALKPKAQAA